MHNHFAPDLGLCTERSPISLTPSRPGVNGEIKLRTAITRLVGTLLLGQNDVYGPPPACEGFDRRRRDG